MIAKEMIKSDQQKDSEKCSSLPKLLKFNFRIISISEKLKPIAFQINMVKRGWMFV